MSIIVLTLNGTNLIPDTRNDLLDLVIRKEVGDLARSQKVIDEDQELLVGNLGVRHQKHYADVLEARLDVEAR